MRGGTVRFAAAIRDTHARRVCCTRCGLELAHLQELPRLDVYDADGVVVERQYADLQYRVIFDSDWQRTVTGPWRYADGSVASRNSHAQIATTIMRNVRRAGVSEVLNLALKKVKYFASRDTGSVEALCPQCSNMNKISIRRPE